MPTVGGAREGVLVEIEFPSHLYDHALACAATLLVREGVCATINGTTAILAGDERPDGELRMLWKTTFQCEVATRDNRPIRKATAVLLFG